ncbi:MAG: substrate-binding domain-containing protein [Zavarzinella sp.]
MAPSTRRIAIMLDLQWPYKRHADIFAGIQEYAEQHHWDTIIDEFAHNTLRNAQSGAGRYDGIIARTNHPLVQEARRSGIPLVNVWASSPARKLVSGVYPDSIVVGRTLAEHLLSRGFRSFATLTSLKNVEHELEVAEFQRTVQDAGFQCVSDRTPQNPWDHLSHWRKTEEVIQQWMSQWQLPIGVYVGSEGAGRMVVQECHRRHWQVPADVAIIAGKNEETLCEHPRPSLTSMEIGYNRIGFEAARMLERMIVEPTSQQQVVRIAPQGLVVRESTDFFAVDSEIIANALRFISANSHKRIGPDHVAKAVGVETRTLQNHFRKVLDRPIATEIRRVRLERAKRELVQSKRSITDIARDTGFGPLARMSEVFQRELGLTPTAYRDQRQLGE